MTALNQVYRCNICSNMVEMVHTGKGTLVCCGQPMELLNVNTVDASKEKHVPVIEKITDGYKVKIGSVVHPMEAKHYIEWIELLLNDGPVLRHYLKPEEAPEASFCTTASQVKARAYCNIHSLWQA